MIKLSFSAPCKELSAITAAMLNQAESSGSESDEDAAPIQRAKARRRAHVIGEEESPVKQPAAKRQRAGDAAEQPAAPELAVPKRLTEPSDDDSDWDIPRHRAAAAGETTFFADWILWRPALIHEWPSCHIDIGFCNL